MRAHLSLISIVLCIVLCIGTVSSLPVNRRKAALIIIDYQNDFVNGSLTVPGGIDIGSKLNELRNRREWDLIVTTQDWHPQDHVSFASNHPGKKPYDIIQLPYGPQVLWPDHCVINSTGAQLFKSLNTSEKDVILRKGSNPNVDSYSAFLDNDKKEKTPLDSILKKEKITEIYLSGLAYDFCVQSSAIDGVKFGYRTYLVEDASSGIKKESMDQARKEMLKVGVRMTKVKFIR